MSEVPQKNSPRWLPAALDYGPLLLFFGGYKILGVLGGTAIFMLAITLAVAVSKWKLGRISPMMWMSAILVLVFGSLTLYLHDPKFIQIKPTIIYSILSAMLFGGLLRGRALLKYVLEHGYDGLSDKGWLLLSRNWAWYFAAMAVSNEVLRASVGFDTWLTIKVWGVTILTILFAAANVPMLIRHGLGEDESSSTQ
jgi:intracellular septation protein